ncbi:hypothetical protein SAMN05421874_12886 [Nonomuraea maritima]|uniref:Uncharacterized protein n=2 Tax=Nonomuraea maritima TaxID=683260 RepID=A0A1G9ML34_9ACTN|nr:hypothetical protein SAMN05421874_12886 [Nonomuraea maritima]
MYIAAAATSVAAAVAAATIATGLSGMTGAVILLWAGVAVLVATLAVVVHRAVAAWRRAYRFGLEHARSTAALLHQPARARL